MEGGYLGPEFTDAEIQSRLNSLGAVYAVLDDSELFRRCATVLAAGAALGWFQGRMEFGPRALGNRSILADPRPASIQTTLNLKIKKRESFRPFAPSILFEDTSAYFELDGESPYMLLVANIVEKQRVSAGDEDDGLNALRNLKRVRSTIPGVTHVDYSARVQTVRADVNSRYHMLLSTFKEVTGCPLLVNTSFNVRGEPIVCTPEEAFRCFMTTEIEALAIGNCFLAKSLQSPDLPAHLYQEFAPD
jgi:carbamoyltransferase